VSSLSPIERYLLTPLEQIAADSSSTPWDAVVVGGGTAGLSAARTLVEHGRRVSVLEGGALALLTHASTTDLRFDSAGLTRFRQMLEYSPRLAGGGVFGQLIACVGGRAMFWNGAAPRFAAPDLAAWPIGLDALGPYYAWAEMEMRVTRDYGDSGLGQTVIRLLREAGLPAEQGPYAIDTHPTHDGWIGGTLGNPVAALLRTGLLTSAPPALRIAGRAFVTRVLVGRDNRAMGVRALSLEDGTAHEVRARSVVLAAGGFESVRLAMASGLPDRSGLMGKQLVDHLFARAYYDVPVALYEPHLPEAAIVVVPSDADRQHQLELHMPSDNLFVQSEYSHWQPAADRFYAAMVRSFAPVEPRDDNYLELGATDAPGDYTVHMSYSPNDLERLERMVQGLESVRRALGGQPADAQRFGPGASHHEAGGLRMGADPATSVTDPFGRVHAVPNVVAADASTWPTTSAANPCLTITALARRQAEQLSRDLDALP